MCLKCYIFGLVVVVVVDGITYTKTNVNAGKFHLLLLVFFNYLPLPTLAAYYTRVTNAHDAGRHKSLAQYQA